MQASIAATVAALQMVFRGQNHISALVVIVVNAFNQLVLHVIILLIPGLYAEAVRLEA